MISSTPQKTGSGLAPLKTIGAPPAAPPKSGSLLAALNKPGKTRHFSKKVMVDIFRGLGSMLKAQINTADAIKYYTNGLPNKPVVDALMKVREDIIAGMNIHEAFRRTGRFNDTIVGLIQAGSDSGQLHYAFQALSERLKSELLFSKKIKKAVAMPIGIITVLIGAFIAAQVKIVPQIEGMMKGLKSKPDGFTAILFDISHVVQSSWFIFVIVVLAIVVTIIVSPHVRNTILSFLMSRWRLLRLLVMGLRQMTFLATIKLLHSNGINLAKSIRISANSVKNTPFYQELINAADKYENSGVPLSTAFAKYTSVDPQVSHMLAIGEKSASVDTQLEMLCEMYDEDTQNYMDTFTAVLSFIVLIIAMVIILMVISGTYLPIFLMGPKLMQGAG
ncbi:MAG: type II secretion system F family protein [Akkermansiaceae bacterium]|nr:type II secretion system F family protein [Akkermansiaceae bacterium]